MALVAIWLVAPIVLCLVVSEASADKIFVLRYLLPYAPGLALLAACVVRSFEPQNLRHLIVLVILASAAAIEV